MNPVVFCRSCFQIFADRKALCLHQIKEHQRSMRNNDDENDGDFILFCPFKGCGKSYTNLHNLNRHKLSHSKPFECKVCKRRFTTNDYLKVHQRIHSKVKTEKCSECNLSFTDPRTLRKHKKIHQKVAEKPFLCRVCHKKFTRKDSLERHWKIHCDENRKVHACPHCDASFVYKYNRNRHIKLFHRA